MTWDCNCYNGEASKEVGKEYLQHSIDLIYLDPPFYTQKDWGEFNDEWGSMKDYLHDLRLVLRSCDNALKFNGSLYLHCDSTAKHHIRPLMDEVLGADNFRNEIIWRRSNTNNIPQKNWNTIHDTIFFYARGDYTFNQIKLDDAGAVPTTTPLYARGKSGGSSGQPWRGIDISKQDRHWSIPSGALTGLTLPDRWKSMTSQEKLDWLDGEGRIHWSRNGNPRLKYVEVIGRRPQSIITDIPVEKDLLYPTQKPLALLERIIKVSSNPGDWIVEPYLGSGTACVAAKQLGRNYTGFDLNENAVQITQRRLAEVLV